MRNSLLILAVLTASSVVCAQTPPPQNGNVFQPYSGSTSTQQVDTPSVPQAGQVTVHTDPKVEELMRRYSAHAHRQQGYRVQIFLGDHKTAEEMKRAFLQKYPDIPAYMSWLAPNFRLRVGDVHTRLEAEHLLREMKVPYPGSYIVPDDIEMPVIGP